MIAGFFHWLGRLFRRVLVYTIIATQAITPLIIDLWEIGSRIVRVALFILLAFPFLIMIVAFSGVPWLVATVTMLVLVAMLCAGIVFINPLLIGIVAMNSHIRSGLRRIAEILAIELLVGVYFTLMSSFLSVKVKIIILLLLFTILFLSLAGQKFAKAMRTVLVLVLICVSALSVVSYVMPRIFEGLPDGLSDVGISYKQTDSEKELVSQGDWLQGKWDEETQLKLEGVRSAYEKGKISLDSALVLTKLIQRRSESFRKELSEKSSSDPSMTTTPATPASSGSFQSFNGIRRNYSLNDKEWTRIEIPFGKCYWGITGTVVIKGYKKVGNNLVPDDVTYTVKPSDDLDLGNKYRALDVKAEKGFCDFTLKAG